MDERERSVKLRHAREGDLVRAAACASTDLDVREDHVRKSALVVAVGLTRHIDRGRARLALLHRRSLHAATTTRSISLAASESPGTLSTSGSNAATAAIRCVSTRCLQDPCFHSAG